jgi:hypothetical protein
MILIRNQSNRIIFIVVDCPSNLFICILFEIISSYFVYLYYSLNQIKIFEKTPWREKKEDGKIEKEKDFLSTRDIQGTRKETIHDCGFTPLAAARRRSIKARFQSGLDNGAFVWEGAVINWWDLEIGMGSGR